MTDALGEHGPVPHRDHDHEDEWEQDQYPAERDAPEQASQGESYRCHIRRGSPRRDNGGLRQRRRRLTDRLRTTVDLREAADTALGSVRAAAPGLCDVDLKTA
ncbi:hypothetical protein GCM10022233_78810 [Streptomyces shaanxiensis]|uniref:Uncharacterized protein n=1 Tax=Streptomyces shaanxiensis TaxID=653357 RepID=A0ABP7WAM4_9ACTN